MRPLISTCPRLWYTTWYSGLLYNLSKLEILTSLVKLISSFPSERKFRVSVEGKTSAPREMQAGVPQGSVLPLHCIVN
jgi:hypothetical protein